MPRTDIDRLSPRAHTWIFGIAPALDERAAAEVLRRVDAFLAGWTAHNVPVTSARQLRDGRFLVVAVEADTERAGCSIDRLFKLVRDIEQAHGVSMLDPQIVFYRDADGAIRHARRGEFAAAATPDTPVFDTTAESLGEIRSGAWERPARDSWHASLLRASA